MADNSIIYYLIKSILYSFKIDDGTTATIASGVNTFDISPNHIIVGEYSGKIKLLFANDACAISHWHTGKINNAISCNNGNIILSGGEEGVLVQWMNNLQTKTFLPRLGGAIINIVCSNDWLYTACALGNNSIVVIKYI